MPIGIDCDITLTHASVNSGNAYGFLLKATSINRRGVVKIKREAYDVGAGNYQDRLSIECVIICADNLINPNGSKHSAGRTAMYNMLVSFLAQRSAITLIHAGGTITSLYATLVTTTEEVLPDRTEVTLKLNNGVAPQVPPEEQITGQIAVVYGTIDGVASTNTGTWASAPITLEEIGDMMATPGGTVSAYDPGTSSWKIITRAGAVWMGDTTYIVYHGTIISFSGCASQHFYLPWIPTLDQAARVLQASNILMDSNAGVSGSFVTADGTPQTVTVTKGIITNIV
jgi:hypothetical protein